MRFFTPPDHWFQTYEDALADAETLARVLGSEFYILHFPGKKSVRSYMYYSVKHWNGEAFLGWQPRGKVSP